MKYFPYFLSLLFFTPFIASAEVSGISGLISAATSAVFALIPIVFSLALIVFLWGLGRFVYGAGNEESHEEGRRLMFWGVIGLFVMASIWAIVAFINSGLDLSNQGGINYYVM